MSPPCFRWCPCKSGLFRHSEKTSGQDDTKSKGSRWRTVRMWCSRCPFATSVAFFMCTGGSIMFGVCLYEAIEYLVLLLELNIVKMAVWAVVGLHILLATYFLVVATLSTGKTREEVTAISTGFNFTGRCAQAGCIATAYVFHLIWLILPAVLLLPLAILVGLSVMCRVVPDCVTLSDYGISPDVVDKYGPEVIANTIRNFNESILLDYADKAESFLLTSIDKAEDSPVLEQLISQIEAHIPDEEEADKFISNLLQHINLEQLTGLLEHAEGGLGYFDKLVEMLEGLPNMEDMVGKLIDMRPDIGDSLKGPISEIGEQIDKGLDSAEDWVDEADNMTQLAIDSAIDATNSLLNETEDKLDDLQSNYDPNLTESAAKVGSEYLDKAGELSANAVSMSQNLSLPDSPHSNSSLPSSLPDEMSGDGSIPQLKLPDEGKLLNTSLSDYDDNVSSGEKEQISRLDDAVPSPPYGYPTKPGQDGDMERPLERSGITQNTDLSEEQASGEEAGREMIEEHVQKVQDTMEDVAQNINEHAEKAQDLATDLAEDASEHVEKIISDMVDLTDGISEHVGDVGEMVEGLSEEVQETARQLIHEARNIATEAQRMAQLATEEVEVAVRRAEQLLREAAQEVDVKARQFALEAAEKAKEAARAAKDAAADAIEKAQVALREADDVIRAASRGAISWAREAMSKVRYYAKKAFGWARHAVKEARKGAHIAVKYVGIAKREFLKTYEIAKEYYHKLEIRRIGKDTFCSDVKVLVCEELQKSAICFILVFLSSIIINLSMVHFMMAMTANYVHLKEEVVKQKLKQQLAASTVPPGEGSSLLFTTLDNGSLVLDVSSTPI